MGFNWKKYVSYAVNPFFAIGDEITTGGKINDAVNQTVGNAISDITDVNMDKLSAYFANPYLALAGDLTGNGETVEAVGSNVFTPETLGAAGAGFVAGGPAGAVAGATASVAGQTVADKYEGDAEEAQARAQAEVAAGIAEAVSLGAGFTEIQLNLLAQAYNTTRQNVEEALKTNPQFIVDSYNTLKDQLDPAIIDKYEDKMNGLSAVLQNGTTTQLNFLNQGFKGIGNKLGEADRLLNVSFNAGKETIEQGVQRLQQKYGDVSGILAGLSGDAEKVLSDSSQTAKQVYESGAVEAKKSIDGGNDKAIQTLKQTVSQAGNTLSGGLRQALDVGQNYQTEGGKGLGAFADSALNPDNAVFKRQLAEAQEALNTQLASRGLLNSGAAVEAQQNLIADMADKESLRQVQLQKDLAGFGETATQSAQAQIGQNTGLRAQLEANTGSNIANIQTAQGSQQAQLQSNLSNQLGQLASMTAEQKVDVLKQLGLADANFQIQSADQVMEIDRLLAQSTIDNSIRRGELNAQQGEALMQQGIAQGNILGSLTANLSNLGQNTATGVLNAETNLQNQGLGLSQEGLRAQLVESLSRQEELNKLPINQFRDQYAISNQQNTNDINLRLGQANAYSNAQLAEAQKDIAKGNQYASIFNQLGNVASNYLGSRTAPTTNTSTLNTPQYVAPMLNTFNPSTQTAPSMTQGAQPTNINIQPTTSALIQTRPEGSPYLDVQVQNQDGTFNKPTGVTNTTNPYSTNQYPTTTTQPQGFRTELTTPTVAPKPEPTPFALNQTVNPFVMENGNMPSAINTTGMLGDTNAIYFNQTGNSKGYYTDTAPTLNTATPIRRYK